MSNSLSTKSLFDSPTYGADVSVALTAGLIPVNAPVYDGGSPIETVGAGKQFATLRDAIAASRDGTVILVDAGTYLNDFATIYNKISIIGVGGMVNLVATVPPPNSKGILTVDNDVSITNVAFSGSAISDDNGGNGAGIRYEGGVMVLENDSFSNNQNGILAAAVIPSLTVNTITIDHSLFHANGSGSGYTHNVYIGTGVSQLTFTNNISENANVGHELKSRAAANIITGNVFRDGPAGTASYDIDLPNGGVDLVANNIIEKGPNAQNNAMVHFGGEGIPYAGSSLTVRNNSFINDKGANTVAVLNHTALSVTITANSFTNIAASAIAVGPASETGNADGNGAALANNTLTSLLPGNTLVITDGLAHAVTLNSQLLAVQGGAGYLTVSVTTGHTVAIGGAGGIGYFEQASSGGNKITTAAGAINTVSLGGLGGDTLDSAGTDTIAVTNAGNLIAAIKGTAAIADGTGNNQYAVTGTATIAGHGGNPVVSVGPAGDVTITGPLGYLQVTTNGGAAHIDITQGGAREALSIAGGAADIRVYNGQTVVKTAGGPTGVALSLGAGIASVVSIGADTIRAGSGDATVLVSGAAAVYAGGGTLSVFGHSDLAGADVFGAGGTVTLDGDTGNITYHGGSAANTVINRLSHDTLIGGAGRMTVTGGSNEIITGGAGGIVYTSADGGGGNTITTAAGSVNSLQLASADTVVSWGTDTISGGFSNSSFALNGNAVLYGSSGNSQVSIAGTATLYGKGQDWITVTSGARATITAGAGAYITETNASVTLTAGTAAAAIAGGVASITGYGAGAGSIAVTTAGQAPVTITGGAGAVSVTSSGADLIHAGSGTTTVTLRGANAQIWGGAGALTVSNGVAETITGGSGGLAYSGVYGSGNTIVTAAGSTNTIQLGNSDSVDSWGSDSITGGYGTTRVAIHGRAVLRAGGSANQITVDGSATIYGANQDTISVTAGGQATITTGIAAYVNETNATVKLSAGAATVTVSGGTASLTSSSNQAIGVVTSGRAPVTIQGVAGAVNVTSSGADLIHTGTGPGTIIVKGANTQIWGSSGALTVHNQDTTAGDKVTITGGSGSLTYDQGGAAMTFIGGSGGAVINGGSGSLYITGGAGTMTIDSGSQGLTFIGGTGSAALSLSSGGGTVQFGSGSTSVRESGSGPGTVYSFVAGHGGGNDVISGFRAGIDKLVLQGGVAVASTSSVHGSLMMRLTDRTSLQLVGVSSSARLFG